MEYVCQYPIWPFLLFKVIESFHIHGLHDIFLLHAYQPPNVGVNKPVDVTKQKSVEIRTSHSFHAEGPSHCPMMSNEQRETHADVIIQYTTPRAHTLPWQKANGGVHTPH